MSDVGESIIKGALEALEFAQGKESGCVVHVPDNIDVSAIRSNMQMTQKQFAEQFGLNPRTLQDWEQGRRTPTGASRVLLQVLSKEPDAVIRALHDDPEHVVVFAPTHYGKGSAN